MRVIKNQLSKLDIYRFYPVAMAIAIFLAIPFYSLPAQDNQKEKPKQEVAAIPEIEKSYEIGKSDRLSITFWQQPDLNRDVRVSEDGTISLPVIGEIQAVGLTTAELSKKIIQQMSIYNTPVSQATVSVLEFNSRSVVVTGQIQTPGTYRYEKMPDVWTAILDAGGPLTDADLARVTIVRREGGKSNVMNVNLYSIIREGDLSKAPQLKAGDLVNVPLSTFGTPLELSTSTSSPASKNIFYIFGQVNEQGPRNLDLGMDVLDAIAVARGFTPEADLKNVKVIIKDKQYASVVKVNLEEYIKTGRPARMILHPEDTIIVPAKRTGFFRSALSTLGSIAPILGAVGTVILLMDRQN